MTGPPILIVGAGICGLTIAQSCRKVGIPFIIFDRDDPTKKEHAGWGLTIHWALPAFKAHLPNDIVERLPETYVNKDAVDAGEKGSFTFFDLTTAEAKWRVPAAERIRVSRLRLRRLLLSGIDVHWSKCLVDANVNNDGVTARFSDESEVSGCVLIGADGSHSVVRSLCHPGQHENHRLPVRFLGATAKYDDHAISAIRDLDPFFLQGSSPRTDVYLWFSFLATPTDLDPSGTASGEEGGFLCQVMLSWPYRNGFYGHDEPRNVPKTYADKLSWMRTLSGDFEEPFKSLIERMPSNVDVREVILEDFLPRPTTLFNGRVFLAGDAAHAMVMFRGEGANHAIVDATNIVDLLQPLFAENSELTHASVRDVHRQYDREMVERNEIAVLASRQACLDANQWQRLNEQSPLLKRRVMRTDLDLDGR